MSDYELRGGTVPNVWPVLVELDDVVGDQPVVEHPEDEERQAQGDIVVEEDGGLLLLEDEHELSVVDEGRGDLDHDSHRCDHGGVVVRQQRAHSPRDCSYMVQVGLENHGGLVIEMENAQVEVVQQVARAEGKGVHVDWKRFFVALRVEGQAHHFAITGADNAQYRQTCGHDGVNVRHYSRNEVHFLQLLQFLVRLHEVYVVADELGAVEKDHEENNGKAYRSEVFTRSAV